MKFKKLAIGLSVVTIINTSTPTIKVFANELENRNLIVESLKEHTSTMEKFQLENHQNFDEYKEEYKIKTEEIESVSSNGGQYSSSSPQKAIDENSSTHWETGKPNSSEFKNEFDITFKELVSIDKITYKVRQDSGTKGFLNQYEIYASKTENEDDFILITKGSGTSTRDTVEVKFDETEVKRIKIKFVEAEGNWASISEVGFYKKDIVMDAMDKLFTDENKNQVSEEYRDINKLNELENLAKEHILYEQYKEQILDAKIVIENEKINASEAKTNRFTSHNSVGYDDLFKMDNSNIQSIKSNGGHYAAQNIEKAIDGDVNTYWETSKSNTSEWNNEVEITFKERIVLDRIIYGARQTDNKGFAEEFEVYASNTSEGDTYQLVATGSHNNVSGQVEAKFESTEFKRVKFKFKKSNQNWATLNEIWFYTEDELANKVERLFTDDRYNTVSEEFNTLDKIIDLENQVKSHPLYNNFKEDIENAKALLSQGQIEVSKATVKPFELESNAEYNELFRMDYSNIKSIKNNGGHYASQNIEKAIDGNLETYWETNKANTLTWSNEVEIELNENVVLDRIVYGARPTDNKGFAREFEIYASTTTKGDTYELVATAKYNDTKELIEAKFEPTEFRRIKFKFKKSNQDWATAREFIFYKQDKLSEDINDIFTDGTQSELKPIYNEEKINQLEAQIGTHPLRNELLEILNKGRDVLKNSEDYKNEIMQFERRGNSYEESVKRKVWNFQDWLPTGYRVSSGDVINVYVDVEKGDPTPNLVFKQMDSSHNGTTTIALSAGKNTITIPEVELDVVPEGTPAAGVIYVTNPYTEQEQSREPKIRFENLEKYPHYIKGIDSDEEVMKELEEYVALLKTDKSLPNVFDVFGDKTLMNVKATDALNWYKQNNKTPSFTANAQDDIIKTTMEIWGFDGSSEINSDFNFRYVGMVKNLTNGAFMNAGNGITGVHLGDSAYLLSGDTGWGPIHEIGHNFDTRNRLIGEVTNNILPLHFEKKENRASRVYDKYQDRIFNKVVKEDYSNNEVYPGDDYSNISNIAVMWQLALYDETFYPKFEQAFRATNEYYSGIDAVHNAWATKSSDVLQMDMTEHFERHGVNITEETREYNSKYPKLDKKTWYMNDNKYLNNASVFTDKLDYKIESIINVDNGKKLEFSINEEDKDNLMGYEIYRDNKLIGFTFEDSFIDEEAKANKGYEYKIVAFDGELNATGSYTLNSLTPTLKTQQEKITIGLSDEFEPKDYIKAISHNGENISSNIEVNNNVDVNKKGNYTVEYSITDENITVKKVIEVEVVSGIDYISDISWESMETQWGTPRLNSNIKARLNGDIKEFEKGIAIHADAKLEYDLGENHKYDTFEAYLGVDGSIEEQGHSSLTFKIVGDGKVLATTKVLKFADDALAVSIPVKGVRNLTIEVHDGGNGNQMDGAVIANPKLATNNKKPNLNIGQDEMFVELNSDATLLDGVSANDAEDGDITGNIVIEDGGFSINKSGDYVVKYTITDSDGNTETKTKKVIVHSGMDYASDIEWEKATTGWQSVNKDKAVGSDNKIKLKVDGTIKEFDKGIGVSTNSEMVYNLEGKNYNRFSTYLGTDKNYEDNRTTIDFTILADGKEVYKSETIRQHSDAEFVSLDITGVKELKLIADNHDGNGIGDFVSYGGAKFYIQNSKPSLEIEKSVSTKVGEPIEDLVGKISATDIEDGDLTLDVVVSGHENIDFNKPGEHTITYTVTDSDNNTVTKERKVSVVDMRDFKFLTEYDWKSAVQSYGTTKKDTNQNGNPLKLTDENNQEVVYEKGIGAHANATIVYDLTDKNYEYFTSFVGVDRLMYGSVASISFEVYVDGEKKFDSGLMNSTDPQQFVEVDINDAKELKLVVTDGGNGIGSDHATWGDAKLHFVNNERADLTSLKEAIEKAETIETNDYTEDSLNNLNKVLNEAKKLLSDDFVNQAQCDEAIKKIEEAINNLEELDKVIKIQDENLASDIKRTLAISNREITLRDMHSLTSLECQSGYVRTLNGLEYAINLESLNVDYNEVNDISAIKNLKKLTNFSGLENFIMNSSENITIKDGKYIIEETVIDSDGEKLVPKEVVLSPRNNPIKLDLDEVLVGNKIIIDSNLFEGNNSVEITYESKYNNYTLYAFTILD